ncbi:MAG: DUF2330 domain-containing protein, partial [Polyangiaceae bacterium]
AFVRPAQACGGCFSPPSASAPVVGHRMAFAIAGERTVLWDQFQYTGEPEDFSWVLPITPGAYLEASSDAWFEALEAYTSVQVAPPPLNCAPPPSSGGCGSSSSDGLSVSADNGGSFAGPTVAVLSRQTVGPYDTVTLRSVDGDALTEWLVGNGYVVPPDVEPIIAAYVNEGADFIALRLSPGQGVQQMTPVRVVTPSGPAILPLRMVAAGVGLSVDIVLFTIGEARFALPDFAEVGLESARLSYDFADNTSNYLELRRQALARNEGSTFLTTYAAEGGLGSRDFTRQVLTSGATGAADNLADLYFSQALENRGEDDPPIESCRTAAAYSRDDALVVRVCEDDEDDACVAERGPGELDSRELVCEGFDDLQAALLGQVPARTWLTRVELNLPRAALAADCVVEPNLDQASVSASLTAKVAQNPPCPPALFSSSLSPVQPRVPGEWLFAGAVALGLLRRGLAGKRRSKGA